VRRKGVSRKGVSRKDVSRKDERRTSVVRLADSPLLVKCADGRLYDFRPYAKAKKLVSLIAAAFAESLSTSEEPETRHVNNRGRYGSITVFLRWTCRQQGTERLELSLATLQAYLQWLLSSKYAPSTVVSHYGTVSGAARALIRTGVVPPFIVPTGISQQEARTFSKGSRTLADLLPGGVEGIGDDQLNEHLLKELLKTCDSYARGQEARIELGARWRGEVESGSFDPPVALLHQPYSTWRLDRLGMVEIACKLVLASWGGDIPSKPAVVAHAQSGEVQLFQAIIWGKGAWGLRADGVEAVSLAELRSYLAPTTKYLAALMPTFLAAGVNPSSLRRLRVDQLVPISDAPESFASIVFEKPRAGGEVLVGPFRVGKPGEFSLPQVWARAARATSVLRDRLPKKKVQNKLLLAARDRGRWRNTFVDVAAPHKFLQVALKKLLGELCGRDSPLGRVAKRLSPKTIRTTAINIANQRMGLDKDLSAAAFGQKPEVLDVAYLLNERIKAELERTMEEGQAALERWLRAPIRVVPNESSAILEACGNDAKAAGEARSGDSAWLNGLCLVHDQALVVDTPINCLRMLQWLECLRAAESRMRRDQPERWKARYEPQIPLFEDALADFSRRTRRAADVLARTHALPMEEIT
jgi:hypothetical protein